MRLHRGTSKRLRVSLLCLATLLGALDARTDPLRGWLSPARDRISDEAIAADLRLLSAWEMRLERLVAQGQAHSPYAIAKARAWLELARVEYTDNDRSGIDEAAFWEAVSLIRWLEAGGRALVQETRIPWGSSKIREDLWQTVETLKTHRGFPCVEEQVARMEVELVWAGNETQPCGNCHQSHVQRAEQLGRLALARADSCIREHTTPPPPVAKPTPPPVSSPVGAGYSLVSPKVLEVPNTIHFALDRAEISAASAQVLHEIVTVMEKHPDIRVYVEGHADTRGSEAYNLALSRNRVQAAVRFLMHAGIARERMSMGYRGKDDPYSVGHSLLDHGLNRRVEIHFFAPSGLHLAPTRQQSDLQLEEWNRR